MTDETKWCSLCQRQVVPKKEFNSIGWVGLVAGLSFLVALTLNEPFARSLANNTLAAALAVAVGNITLNVLLLLIAPLFLINIIYCIHYLVKAPRYHVCNSKQLTDVRLSGISTSNISQKASGIDVNRSSSAEIPMPDENRRAVSAVRQKFYEQMESRIEEREDLPIYDLEAQHKALMQRVQKCVTWFFLQSIIFGTSEIRNEGIYCLTI